MGAARKNIMLGTAGHVDHGKTSLVKLLTGCDTDRLAVEKQRGMTIELGFAPCKMSDERIVGIVDVPGHVDFIRNMAAGAQGVDVVILVVAADDSIMPQTREHLDILTLMGVRHGLVAMTKIDLVDADMRQLVAEDIRAALRGTFLAEADICPISNITGEGFDGFFDALNRAVERCRPREVTGLFRMWVERSFSMRGFGTVASGIPRSGEVAIGDVLHVVPGNTTGRVRTLEVYGEQATAGRAGECVAINLTDVEPDALARTTVLCESDAFGEVGMAEAVLTVLARVPAPLTDYAEVHVHVGTAEVMGNVALLEGQPIAPGANGLVQLRLVKPVAVAPGDRFVVRASVAGLAGGWVTTIGGGRILSTSNIRLRRNRPWTIAMLSARRDAIDVPADWVGVVLAESAAPISAAQLARSAMMKVETVTAVLDQLRSRGLVQKLANGNFIHGRVVGEIADKLVAHLETFHAQNPMRAGLDEPTLLAALACDRDVFDAALAGLIKRNRVLRQGAVIAAAGAQVAISDKDKALHEQIESALRTGNLAPPAAAELAVTLNQPPARVEKVVQLLIDQGSAIRLDDKVVIHRDALAAGKKTALDLFAKQGGFTTMEFRDAVNVSRKYAVPLLDYLDTIHWTTRSGNRRTPGTDAREAMKK
jgi:selenocysteine-specific elongation factor